MALENEYPMDETDFFWGTPETTFLEIGERLISKRTPKWLIGFRDIARATDDRTSLFSALPVAGIGNTCP